MTPLQELKGLLREMRLVRTLESLEEETKVTKAARQFPNPFLTHEPRSYSELRSLDLSNSQNVIPNLESSTPTQPNGSFEQKHSNQSEDSLANSFSFNIKMEHHRASDAEESSEKGDFSFADDGSPQKSPMVQVRDFELSPTKDEDFAPAKPADLCPDKISSLHLIDEKEVLALDKTKITASDDSNTDSQHHLNLPIRKQITTTKSPELLPAFNGPGAFDVSGEDKCNISYTIPKKDLEFFLQFLRPRRTYLFQNSGPSGPKVPSAAPTAENKMRLPDFLTFELPCFANSSSDVRGAAEKYRVGGELTVSTFSHIYECSDAETGKKHCLKKIKDDKRFFDQSLSEIAILCYLKESLHGRDGRILNIQDFFFADVR